MNRRKTRTVNIGGVSIGGDNPVAIQSMCNVKGTEPLRVIDQILELERAGCDIVRIAVPDEETAGNIPFIKQSIHIPLVADIHFDYRLALAAIENGADKIRINPGNIGSEDRVKAVADAAKAKGIPIRVGVNSGSLEKDILQKYGRVTAEGLAESALRNTELLEKTGFEDIVISIKSSDVMMCVNAYRILADRVDYPFHIGITEAGTDLSGNIKSAVGLGIMLENGMGDTIRVSLSSDPVREIRSAKLILRALGLRKGGVEIISCPTCGRTDIDVISIAEKMEELTADIETPLKVAVMGCAVNGPGEAREADLGIAGGKGEALLFSKGQIIKKVREDQVISVLMDEIKKRSSADDQQVF
ncbi:MAG: flavodoxin-dependent (E)-4-hydroxy-3-methylbut-2-enyl-diphosphate synthase [Lachnospiraceae bacterium]|nr:flavodoxin-dependent (E)-4-hydroxy-3-methylbut-2-enyl-diphosphate synthase [Lachnospiraceae bacterium]